VKWLGNIDQQSTFTASGDGVDRKPAISTATRLQRATWIVITRQSADLVNLPVIQQTRISIVVSMVILILT
jgi:hypothetical protein